MKIFRLALLCLMVISSVSLDAQSDEKAIKAVINQFFEGMERGDTALIRRTCTAEPVMQTFMADRNGEMKIFTEDFGEFLSVVGAPSKDKYREVIEFEAIHVEKSLASVWTPYKFYINGKVSHTGTNSFQLVKTAEGWRIQYIIDTRRRL
ncbi:MAG: nuclear transport factor 2 family protein [Saprospiraceae bacterium]|nr:nuclear transport factor 2 family protein [Saprospiraceae bacterium]